MNNKSKHQHRQPISTPESQPITTVSDLLTTDDVNGILSDLNKVKHNISDLIVIYLDKETKRYSFQITANTLVTTVTWMLESTKLDVLEEDDEE